ncbi:MAG: phycobilisome linker polypeptide, partial [Leptolyngbyaceae cyanobacterium bins.59]|nr:phycobilisome linker polypeptide [Leptolyngbyaceae cyanobacterium bins.59]
MYSSSTADAANTEFGSRVFQYEVVGLRQNDETNKAAYPIRRSGSVFITVPYGRMNEFMRRMARLGGKIVSIRQLDGSSVPNGQVKLESSDASVPGTTPQTAPASEGKSMTQAKAKVDVPVN